MKNTVCIVMPAFNSEETISKTFFDIPESYRSNVIVVDDASSDKTVKVATALDCTVIKHETNRGYGANQKTCYREALAKDANFIVMLHPDYQYDSRVIGAMVQILELGICDIVLGNRIRNRKESLKGGMPLWKYLVNRFSTFMENLLLGQTLGDFHSGLRAYTREVLSTVPFELNSDSFLFDQQMLLQAISMNYRLGDIPVPVRYFQDSSSIGLKESIKYGLGTSLNIIYFFLHKWKIKRNSIFVKKIQSQL